VAIAVVLALQSAPSSSRTPVVVELFTSEGCSSCPPADILLTTLLKEQPVAGVQIIPLGMHVTYWDQLGWKDPASLRAATERQQDYARVFGPDRVYTPQAVIDGRTEVIGSDADALKRAVEKAAKQAHLRVELSASVRPDGIYATLTTRDRPVEGQEGLRQIFIITENGLTSIVKRGENGGRTLRNDAVVRRIIVGDHPIGQLPGEWRRDQLYLTGLVQGEKTRRIYGAATVPLK
jgi:hypothetical protein